MSAADVKVSVAHRPIYKPVRSVERAFSVLRAVNVMSDASVEAVARMTGLSWATALRMLETLEGLGYVTRGAGGGKYRPAIGVRALSDGFRDETWISEFAGSGLERLTEKFGWPAIFSTLDGTEMMVRESTQSKTPLAIERGMLGRRVPLLSSSGGRAYLSYTSEAEREHLLSLLRQRGGDDQKFVDSAAFKRMMRQIRYDGYAQRYRGTMPMTSSIAVPVLFNDHIVGCITIIWIASALSLEDAASRYVKPLQNLARDLASKSMRLYSMAETTPPG
jgi:IclR family transcriptional regulator, mhp operon transcriptional activator